MAMVCPRCHGTYDQRWTCPACDVRLAYGAAARGGEASPQWQQTPWGRIFCGLLLAQGLYYGLRQFVVAGVLAAGDGTQTVGATLAGLLLLQGIQVVGLLIAGVFTGAGQRQGIVNGAVLGVWNGVLAVTVQSLMGGHTTVTLLGQPILHTAFGALGGFLGSRVWRPPPSLTMPSGVVRLAEAPAAVGFKPRAGLLAGPVSWTRVLLGAAVAVAGTLWAHVILELVLDASDGKLAVDSQLQAQLVTWEVTALAMLGGAALAGSNAANSLKQGICVGLAVTAVLVGLRLATQESPTADLVLTGVSSLGLGIAGAWFGGSMFPPLAKKKPKGLGPEAA